MQQDTPTGAAFCNLNKSASPRKQLGAYPISRWRSAAVWCAGYFALVLIAIFASNQFWRDRVNGVLYYCSERYAFDFFVGPPFVHVGSWYVNTGDHDVAPQEHVTRLWWALWIACFVFPALALCGGCILRRFTSRATVAAAPNPSRWKTVLCRFGSVSARVLIVTLLVVGVPALIICVRFAGMMHRGVGHRHDPNYSDATITDVPILVRHE